MAQSFNLTARINLQGPFNLKPIVSKIKKDIGSINPTIKFKLDPSAAKSVAKVTSEIKKLQTATNNAQKSVGSLNTQLLSLSSSFNAAATASKNVANATTNVGRAAANSAKSVSQARTAIEEFGKQSGLAIKRFAAFSSVTTVVFGLTSALVSAYKEFIVFNREIVRLSQVTGKSVSNLKGISDEITRLSTSLGVASTDLISITSTLAQAGLSAEDTKVALEALAKSTLAPTFKDIQNTTEGAIAAIRQFGLETRELDGALGSINAVAGAFAVEADDIVAAIQRTGGVFASTSRGVSEGSDALNEFIAIFTSVRQTTRESAETIATGLRTIFTRIQRSETIDLLKQYGVELRDLEGKFVGPFEAVKRLSEGLSGIDPRSADFAKISEELGGFRQIGKVIPLIQQFAVAQDALNVAQKGSGSLTKDVIAAQQSLAVQFTKTRENFLALIRDIGEGQSFKVFVGSTLTLTNGLISLGQALKPILPLLLTFGAIKIGSGINQFLSGFGLAFNRGGGGSGGGAAGTSVTSPSGKGGGNQPLTAALTLNTTATNSLVQTLGTLNTTVSSLNQNIILLVNKPSSPGFASGGLVPGTGNRDTFNANLMPGEFVIRKKAVQSIGINNLANMNRGNISPSRFANGGKVEDRIQFSQGEDNRFGLVGLKSGTGDGFGLSQTKSINLGGKYGTALLDIATISQEQGEAFSSAVEEAIEQSFILSTSGIANQISKQLKVPGNPVDTGNLSSILKGSGLANVVGAALETAIALTGAEYWDKTESTKSIDFPFGLGPAAGLFGANFPGNIPTDVTKTIGGVGKGETQIAGQIKRFIDAIYGEQFTKAEDVRASAAGAQNLSPILSKTLDTVKKRLGGGGRNLDSAPTYNQFLQKWGSRALNIRSAETVLKQLPVSQQSEYVTDWRNLVASAIGKKRTVKRADGGGISAQDTVPALLTPGEFVFNKKAAQKIGYGNLNRLNKADKIQGFNKGGVVGPQKFAIGGAVRSDPTLIGAALASVLLPEIQKLANTFNKLEGSVGDFGTALGGAIRESSSIVLSAGIGLRAVGASSRTIAAAQIGGGLLGGIGGALTDTSSKLLERALLDNTQALGKFNKSLQDFANAPTEELKIEAAAQVEKNFIALDQALQNTKQNIDNLENIKNLGQSITNVNLTILSTVTAVQALSAVSKQAALTVANARLAQAGQTIAVSAGTRLLAKFGRAIPIIGSFISIGSVALEAFSFFSTKLKSTDDQFNQLNQALRETIKISNNYNLANENFLNNILPLYRELRDRTRGGTSDAVSEIGSLRGTQLNLTRDFLIRNLANRAGVGVRSTESIQQAQQRARAFPELARRLEDAIVKANIRYVREGFTEALRAQGVTDPTEIQKRAQQLGGFDSAAVRQIASQFFGEQDRRLLAERDLAEASRNLQTNLINLTNTVTNLESIFNKSLSNLSNSFDDLNQDIDVLTGSFKITGGIGVGRDIQVLENLKQATPEIISGVLQRLAPFIGDPARGTPEEAKIFNEIVDAIQAYSALQKTTDILLNKIAQENLTTEQSGLLLERELKPILIKSLGGGEEAAKKADTLIGELGAAVQSANIAGQPLVSLKDAGSKAAAFGTLLSQLESTAQGAVTALKSLEKAQQLQAENISRRIELEQKFNELALQKQQTEIRNNLELKRILGQRISLEETNAEFLAEISSRSEKSGVPLQIIGGQITSEQVSLIAQELEKTKNDLIRRNQQLRKAGQGGNGLEQLDSVSIRLSKKGQNLQKVLELLATSGILVKNAFENISKTQDLFKSQDQLEFELLRDFGDPAKAFDLTETLRAIEAVKAGTADLRQAQIAAERGPDLLRRATGEESAEQFAVLARETYRALIPLITEEQRLAKENLDKYRAAEKKRIEELKQTTQQEQAAFNALLKANADALSFSTGNITKIFDGFAPQVKTAWKGLISTILTIQNRVQEQAKITENVRRISQSSQQEAILAVASLTAPGNVNLPLGPGGKRLSYTRPSVLSEARAEETFSIISTGDAKQIIKELERLRRDIIQSPDTFLGPDRTTREARANQVLGPILRDLNQQQDQQLKQVPTRPPTREQLGIPFGELEGFLNKLKTEVNKLDLKIKIPSFDFSLNSTDSATLNRFSSSVQSLSTALVADDGNINNLASAVNSLTPVTNDLKTAVTELSKLFKDGKIQLDQQANANVNVTFENGIPLETESGLDSKIASNIQALLNTTLDQKFSSLIRTLLS
jgi:TP901 family phage tail tape measure protein